jgi:zinc transporter ZupT
MLGKCILLFAVIGLSRAEPEWMAAFELADASHTWIMQTVDGAYADPTMWLVLIPTADPTKDEVASLEEQAEALAAGPCPTLTPGSTMMPAPGGSCFTLAVDESMDDSAWLIDTTGLSGVAMYAQHVPTEFERDTHYFRDSAGGDIEPVDSPPAAIGLAIGAALIVNAITAIGVIFLIPVVRTLYRAHKIAYSVCANAFAAGALIAAAFYLMFFEGSHYVAVGAASESQTAFLWGTMALAGAITASVLDLAVSAVLELLVPDRSVPKPDRSASKEVDSPEQTESAKLGRVVRVRCGVLVGDFMHNFCDGIFIGTAFASCSTSLAWNITVATVAHELAQEVSDHVILTDPAQGNLTPLRALALNFLSGISVLLGTITVMSADQLDSRSVGMVLVFGGGIYLQVGLVECMARVHALASSLQLKTASIAFFVVGAIAIGLVLLDHQHCEAGGSGHSHGHGH